MLHHSSSSTIKLLTLLIYLFILATNFTKTSNQLQSHITRSIVLKHTWALWLANINSWFFLKFSSIAFPSNKPIVIVWTLHKHTQTHCCINTMLKVILLSTLSRAMSKYSHYWMCQLVPWSLPKPEKLSNYFPGHVWHMHRCMRLCHVNLCDCSSSVMKALVSNACPSGLYLGQP